MAQSDIMVSGAWLWYAPEGEGFPDETSIDVGDDWGGNWEWLGLTTAPLTMNLESEEFEVDVQQLTVAVLQSITSEEIVLSTTLAEMTALNLDLLFGGNITVTAAAALQKGYTELKFGGRTQRNVYAVGFEVRHTVLGVLQPLRLFFYRATFSLGGPIPFDKGAPSAIPVNVTILADDEQLTDEKLGVWQKVTAAAVP